ncbi:zinc ABC transporter substrate-binding protein [Clostridiaceae bacterium M8S5]|nr:zinc ABC transporter substrate-binding protein [Clostridiaceae bacterium M8S5]
MKRGLLLICMIISLTVVGCDKLATKLYDEDKLIVGATILPQETFIKEVAGDKVEVVTIVPHGHSPANYEITPKSIEKLSSASVYFSIGVPTENSILPKLQSINKSLSIVNLVDIVKQKHELLYFSEDSIDPHIWMSPRRVITMIDEIALQLGKIDENNRAYYRKNAEQYKERLKGLDYKLEKEFSYMRNKDFIMYHPSLGYFADDYGLNMIVVESDGKEASVKQLQSIIDTAKIKNIKAIFYQSQMDSMIIETLAKEINGTIYQINPLSKNYIKNMLNLSSFFQKINID